MHRCNRRQHPNKVHSMVIAIRPRHRCVRNANTIIPLQSHCSARQIVRVSSRCLRCSLRHLSSFCSTLRIYLVKSSVFPIESTQVVANTRHKESKNGITKQLYLLFNDFTIARPQLRRPFQNVYRNLCSIRADYFESNKTRNLNKFCRSNERRRRSQQQKKLEPIRFFALHADPTFNVRAALLHMRHSINGTTRISVLARRGSKFIRIRGFLCLFIAISSDHCRCQLPSSFPFTFAVCVCLPNSISQQIHRARAR